jgi:uncharacterized protein (DUF362 family)/ferredoxin
LESRAQQALPVPVSVVRCDTYAPDAVAAGLAALLEPLGGLGAFVTPGAPSVLKPNFLMPHERRDAVCTDPEVIRQAARAALEGGASAVIVTDSPGFGTAQRCARKLGLGSDEGFEVVDAEDPVDIAADGARYHRLFLSRRMVEAGSLINLGKAKTHGQMVITGAAKNTFGAIVGMEKAQLHYRSGRDLMDFARLLVHVHSLLPVRLNIVDAVIGMEGNGPGSGTPRALGALLASTNAHALDHVLCRMMGVDPSVVPTLAAAREMGLLPSAEDIRVIGPSPDSFKPSPPWRMARPAIAKQIIGPAWMAPVFDRLLSIEPRIDRRSCTGCGRCTAACAAKAMRLVADPHTGRAVVEIDRRACISCFCCQEICPEGAISVKAGMLARLMGLGVG